MARTASAAQGDAVRILSRFVPSLFASSALTLLVGQQEGHPACKKTEWWGAIMVVCLERGADLHMAQLMPLPLTVYCFSKIHIGFTFLVPAHLGSPGQRAVKRVCVCVWSLYVVRCYRAAAGCADLPEADGMYTERYGDRMLTVCNDSLVTSHLT